MLKKYVDYFECNSEKAYYARNRQNSWICYVCMYKKLYIKNDYFVKCVQPID